MSIDFEFLKTLPFASGKNGTAHKVTKNVTFNLEKTGEQVTLIPFNEAEEVPIGLLELCHEEFNYIIEEGRTYPFYKLMTLQEFKSYLFEGFVAILIKGEYSNKLFEDLQEKWRSKYLGHFYIKPNYVGRCSHVCNAGFVVPHTIRGKGIGKEMGKKYLEIAPQLGYIYSVFNLVFETNQASARIWDSLGFSRIGYVKNVAILKGEDKPVGAYIYGKDLV